MIIILAVLSLIVVKALTSSPWGLFTIAATIPIALADGRLHAHHPSGPRRRGVGVRRRAAARCRSSTAATSPRARRGRPLFTLTGTQLAWALIIYGAVAASLPVWLMLAPRDYLSTFLKIGTVVALAHRHLLSSRRRSRCRPTTRFIDGTGPVFSGSLFPFLFITIACGAVSGFHSLISSGTTPKMVEKESHMRLIGFGGMLAESFVAIMALTAACVLDPGIYFAMNAPAAVIGTTAANAAQVISELGLHDHAGDDQADRQGHRRDEHPVARGRRAHAGGRHGADPRARRSAASRWRRSGTTSRSCSRRCSS